MAITTVAFLILIGFALLLTELFFVPGTNIFGIIGMILMIAGVTASYSYFGQSIGTITLTATFIGSIIATLLAFRKFESGVFGLKETLDGRVNELKNLNVSVHTQGKAVGDLKPHGRAMMNGQLYNVDSSGKYIEDGSSIEIIEITEQKIIVRKIN